MDTLSSLLNFILQIQSPERLNHLLKITLQISSRSRRSSQLPHHCLCVCHLQLNYRCFQRRGHSTLQTCNTIVFALQVNG